MLRVFVPGFSANPTAQTLCVDGIVTKSPKKCKTFTCSGNRTPAPRKPDNAVIRYATCPFSIPLAYYICTSAPAATSTIMLKGYRLSLCLLSLRRLLCCCGTSQHRKALSARRKRQLACLNDLRASAPLRVTHVHAMRTGRGSAGRLRVGSTSAVVAQASPRSPSSTSITHAHMVHRASHRVGAITHTKPSQTNQNPSADGIFDAAASNRSHTSSYQSKPRQTVQNLSLLPGVDAYIFRLRLTTWPTLECNITPAAFKSLNEETHDGD
jgi:hypothetical protein